MYKVEDIVELFGRNQKYEIIDKIGDYPPTYSVKGLNNAETFLSSEFNIINKQYQRRKKLEKICAKLSI